MLSDVFSKPSRHSAYIKYCKQANAICLGPNWDVPTRWNSTCTMFEKALKQKDSLRSYHNDLCSRHSKLVEFSINSWALIEDLTKLLHVFKEATTTLSGVYYPTSPLVLNQIFLMCQTLNEYSYKPDPFSEMVKPMKAKFVKYFENMPAVITCASALHPCINSNNTEALIENICYALDLYTENELIGEELKRKFNKDLTNLYDAYVAKYGTTSTIHESMRQHQAGVGASSSSDRYVNLFNMFSTNNAKRARGNTPSSELGRYMGTDFLAGIGMAGFKDLDLLAWWKGKEKEFPVLSIMARDLLSVQASTVASESAFSVSGRVISVRRTRLTPASVEMSICLKDYLDAAERIQNIATLEGIEGEMEYEGQLYDEEVAGGLTPGMTDDEAGWDYYLRSGPSSSGSSNE